MPTHGFRADVAIVLLTILSLCTTVNAQTAPTTRIATANPIRIFTQIQKTKDLQSAMQTKTNALLAQRSARAKPA